MIFDVSVQGRTVKAEVKATTADSYTVVIDGRPHVVDFRETGRDFASLLLDGRSFEAGLERREDGFVVHLPADNIAVVLQEAARGSAAAHKKASGPSRVTAPMPGKVVRLLVEAGQEVAAGAGLLVMEAMKMENELRAPRAGRVQSVAAREGLAVETGALLVVIE